MRGGRGYEQGISVRTRSQCLAQAFSGFEKDAGSHGLFPRARHEISSVPDKRYPHASRARGHAEVATLLLAAGVGRKDEPRQRQPRSK